MTVKISNFGDKKRKSKSSFAKGCIAGGKGCPQTATMSEKINQLATGEKEVKK
jgi:hypothetical protein